MPEGNPQLVIEVYAAPGEEPQIIVRPGAGASTTIAPLAAVPTAPLAAVPAAPKKRARRKAAVGTSQVVQEAQPADGEDQDVTETATTASATPTNGRKKKAATKKKAAKKRGRQPLPDKQMLQATEGDSVAELSRLNKKWYLTIDGEPANEGKGWISRKQALDHAAEIMGEVEVIAEEAEEAE